MWWRFFPGTTEPERQVLVSGHYDTINMTYKTGANGQRELDPEATVAAPAPGVTDDGSGTAAVMELARVMSQYKFRKSIVFILFAAVGFSAIRITTPMENFSNQHTATDTFANTAPPYTALATKANAAAIASLALGPKTPEITAPPPAARRTFASPLTRVPVMTPS